MPLMGVMLSSKVALLASMSVLSTVKALKIGKLMVLMLGQEPATVNFWLRDEKANSRVLAVRNGRALGILSRSVW